MANRAAFRARNARGFTLLEVLVALVIFAIITVAVSFTFDTAISTQQANTRRLEELGAVRSVFDYVTRDVQQAYASSTSTAAVFIAGTPQSGPQSASNGALLTMMSRGARLISDTDSGAAQGSSTQGPAAAASNPQSETQMVRYDFDPQARTLSRSTVNVPSLQAIQQASPGPDSVICSLVESISLRFYDPVAQSWRSDWDYEQQNQQSQQSGTTGATGTSGATSGSSTTAGSSAANSSTNGDTTLPSMMEVTLTIRHQDSTTATYVSTIPIITSQVADGMAPPVNTGTTTTSVTGK